MKIKTIHKNSNNYNIFHVSFIPNWFEKLFGYKPITKKYKMLLGSTYTFGGGNIYVDENGNRLGNGNRIGEAIDAFQRKF